MRFSPTQFLRYFSFCNGKFFNDIKTRKISDWSELEQALNDICIYFAAFECKDSLLKAENGTFKAKKRGFIKIDHDHKHRKSGTYMPIVILVGTNVRLNILAQIRILVKALCAKASAIQLSNDNICKQGIYCEFRGSNYLTLGLGF